MYLLFSGTEKTSNYVLRVSQLKTTMFMAEKSQIASSCDSLLLSSREVIINPKAQWADKKDSKKEERLKLLQWEKRH